MCTIMTAHRSGAVAEGTSDLRRLPADAEPCKLQSGASHAAGSGNEVGQSRRRV